MLVHECRRNIIKAETRKVSPQTVVGIVAEDEQVAVGQSDSLDHPSADERSLEVAAHNGYGRRGVLGPVGEGLLAQFLSVHRGQGIGDVEVAELMREHLAVEQSAWCEDACAVIGGMEEQHAEAVGTRKYVIVHAPYPVGTTVVGLLDAGVETT